MCESGFSCPSIFRTKYWNRQSHVGDKLRFVGCSIGPMCNTFRLENEDTTLSLSEVFSRIRHVYTVFLSPVSIPRLGLRTGFIPFLYKDFESATKTIGTITLSSE